MNENSRALWQWSDRERCRESETCSDAFRMQICLEPVDNKIRLRLDALFSTDSVPYSRKNIFGHIDECNIEYALNGGELRIALKNGKAPISGRYCGHISETIALSRKATRTVGAEVDLSSFKAIVTGEEEEGQEYSEPVMTALGPDELPGWRFQTTPPQRLKGKARGDDPPLAYVSQSGEPVEALAAFIVAAGQIQPVALHARTYGGKMAVRLAVARKALPELVRNRSSLRSEAAFLMARSYASFSPPVREAETVSEGIGQ